DHRDLQSFPTRRSSDLVSDKGTPSADWHWACPAQLELVSTSRGGVRCLTGVRQRHTFNGLALGLNRSAGARERLQRGCEVFDRCPTKAHLQRTGTEQLELVSTSRGGVRCLTGVRQRHTFSGLALGLPRSAGAR